MAIRHVITIQVAPGRADDFAGAFKSVQAITQQEEGCEQYELFQSIDEPEKVVLLERWASQELLDKHMVAERTRNAQPSTPLWLSGRPAAPRVSSALRCEHADTKTVEARLLRRAGGRRSQ
jgi:quinol monooxygenase YgiN